MTKLQKIEYITKQYDYIERMQKPLGHHSWWYTNRNSDDCINVKIHAYIDSDALLAKLTPQQEVNYSLLGLEIDDYINEHVWEHYGTIHQHREQYEEDMKEKFSQIDSFDYGGNSGGWLCIVYNFDNLRSDMEDIADYNETDNKIVNETYKNLIKAEKTIAETITYTEKAVKGLENYIESDDLLEEIYTNLTEYIDDRVVRAQRLSESLIV